MNRVTENLKRIFPEEVAEFDRWWEEEAKPKFKKGFCRRCGMPTAKADRKLHQEWHYDISLSFYMQGMMISKCAEGLKTLLDEVAHDMGLTEEG